MRPLAPPMTYAEVQALIHEPPGEPATWIARTIVPRRETRVVAHSRTFARNIGAQLLRTTPDRVVVGRADVVSSGEPLSGSRVA